eukprot:COSAG06_NODE_29674_length_552_cov_0.796909_1_plen_43_part_01
MLVADRGRGGLLGAIAASRASAAGMPSGGFGCIGTPLKPKLVV